MAGGSGGKKEKRGTGEREKDRESEIEREKIEGKERNLITYLRRANLTVSSEN
ncbi:MAG: hypothetical protein MJE68_00605 [Proteobacteria bacterium]|nr:hypothetical protein [Pseudomonadota bacterium]